MRLEGNTLVVSRRNLESLLAKLDGYPNESACRIGTPWPDHFWLAAEPDEVHYAHPSRNGTPPGVMHPDTERAITHSAANRSKLVVLRGNADPYGSG